MKHSIIIISAFLLSLFISSCSTSKVVGGGFLQKRKYNKGFFVQKKSTVKNTAKTKKEIHSIFIPSEEQEEEFINDKSENQIDTRTPFGVGDSVKITLQDGTVYYGTVTKEAGGGIFLRTSPTREIFLKYQEITSMDIVTNDPEAIKTTQEKEENSSNNEVKKEEEPIESYDYYEAAEEVNKKGVLPNKYSKWAKIYLAGGLLFSIALGVLVLSNPVSTLAGLLMLLLFSLVVFCMVMANINAIIGLFKSLRNKDVYSVKSARNTLIFIGIITLFLLIGTVFI